nr:MAG TPA: hypothetical protein [Caudoviricetes sp.]
MRISQGFSINNYMYLMRINEDLESLIWILSQMLSFVKTGISQKLADKSCTLQTECVALYVMEKETSSV